MSASTISIGVPDDVNKVLASSPFDASNTVNPQSRRYSAKGSRTIMSPSTRRTTRDAVVIYWPLTLFGKNLNQCKKFRLARSQPELAAFAEGSLGRLKTPLAAIAS